MLGKYVSNLDNSSQIDDLEEKVDYLLEQMKLLNYASTQPQFISTYSTQTHTISATGTGSGSIPLATISGPTGEKGFVLLTAVFDTDSAHSIMASISFGSNSQLFNLHLPANQTTFTLSTEVNLGQNLAGNFSIIAGEADVKVSNIGLIIVGKNITKIT